MEIPTKRLSDGCMVPVLGLGTWQLTGGACVDTVRAALQLGYRHIDTAEAYRNEREIGIALKDVPRKEVFLVSKIWPSGLDQEEVRSRIEAMLTRLDTDYLDMLLLHWPKDTEDLKTIFSAFKSLIEEGKVRSCGVSNFTTVHLEHALPIAADAGLDISVNQVEFHPQLNQDGLRRFCERNGVAIVAYSPLARGNVKGNVVLEEIADELDRSVAQVSLRWIMQKDLVTIPKASSEEHLKENLGSLDFTLTDAQMRRIDEIDMMQREVDPPFAQFGKEDVET